jgi:Tol biopolymer transport system component
MNNNQDIKCMIERSLQTKIDAGKFVDVNPKLLQDFRGPLSDPVKLSPGLTGRGSSSQNIRLPASAVTDNVRRVSEALGGIEGNGFSETPSISDSGFYVAYASAATNLVPGDINLNTDIFWEDPRSNITRRISVGLGGAEANAGSANPFISPNGRLVVYESDASNLVSGDTNGLKDVFLYDVNAGTNRRISLNSLGGQGNGNSFNPSISADSRYIVYESDASNLVFQDAAGQIPQDTNGVRDIFIYDIQTQKTRRVSVDDDSIEGNGASKNSMISANGRFVIFQSEANNLVSDDTNNQSDIFVHDLVDNITTLASVIPGQDPSISYNGRFLVYSSDTQFNSSDTNNASDIFFTDLATGATALVSVGSGQNGVLGNGGSFKPYISGGARFVGYESDASNLVAGDNNGVRDIILRDMIQVATKRISVDTNGVEGNGASGHASLNGSGAYIAFDSLASNLIPLDSNGQKDVFVARNFF